MILICIPSVNGVFFSKWLLGTTVPSPFPNVGHALRGYNILKGNPLTTGVDPGFTGDIFEAIYTNRTTSDLRYTIPEALHALKEVICQINFQDTTESISSVNKYQKLLGVSVQFSGWKAAFNADIHYKDTTQKISKQNHIFQYTESVCNVYEVNVEHYNPPKFAQGFVNGVNSLENTDDYDTYLEFVNVYGTHYLKTTYMGAKYIAETEFTKTSKWEM